MKSPYQPAVIQPHSFCRNLKKQILFTGLAMLLAPTTYAVTLNWGGGTTTPSTSIDTTGASFAALSGTWDATTTSNWNTSTSAATGYQTWVDGSIVGLKSSQGSAGVTDTISLKSNFSVGGFVFTTPTGSSSQKFLLVGDTASTNHTITLANDGVITVQAPISSNSLIFGYAGAVSGRGAAILAGNNMTFNGLTVAGGISAGVGSMAIQSASTLGGTVKINSGALTLGVQGQTNSQGSLANVNTFNVLSNNATLSVVQKGVTNAIADTANIRLASGALSLLAGATNAAANETVGGIILEGSGMIVADTYYYNTSTAASTLTLTNGFSRGGNGKGVLVVVQGTEVDGGLGTTSGLTIAGHGFGSSTSFIPYALAQGQAYNVGTAAVTGTIASARFMATDASGKLGVINSTAGDGSLANWSSAYSATSDIHFDDVNTGYLTGALTGPTAIHSLAISSTASTVSGTLALGGNTLKVDAIGVAIAKNANSLSLGSASNDGSITANGVSGGDVYIIHQRQNNAASSTMLTVNSKLADNGGAVNFILGGQSANFILAAANTHTGKTYINGGYVKMAWNGSLLSTSEINIAAGAQFDVSSVSTAANTTYGGGSVVQKIAGGGGPDVPGATWANIIGTTRTVTIGANGAIAPGNSGGNETLSFSFSTGKLAFASGAKVDLDLGSVANSDKISFGATAGDFISGHNNMTLNVTPNSGFMVGGAAGAYTVFNNVNTAFVNPTAVKINGNTLAAGDYSYGASGNDYKLTVNKLSVAADSDLGAAPTGTTANSLVLNSGTLAVTANMTMDSKRGIGLGDGTAGTVNGTIDTAAGTTLTYNGIIANNGSSTGGLVKSGAGTLTLGGSNTYTGTTTVSGGVLNGSGSTGNVVLASGTLGGTLSAGAISGSGLVSPGNSPGILTASSVTSNSVSGLLNFAFELTASAPDYTSATNSLNDVLHITSNSGLTLEAGTTISVYFSDLSTLTQFDGGFFVDGMTAIDLKNAVSNASFAYYKKDAAGTYTFNGNNYSLLDPAVITVSSINVDNAAFATGSVSGGELEFTVVPEPSTWAMLVGGVCMLVFSQRLRRRSCI